MKAATRSWRLANRRRDAAGLDVHARLRRLRGDATFTALCIHEPYTWVAALIAASLALDGIDHRELP